jgi:hypothetical protein
VLQFASTCGVLPLIIALRRNWRDRIIFDNASSSH